MVYGIILRMSLVAQPSPQGLRILVVDDDSLLLAALQDALEREGHFVQIADGGQAGIDAFSATQHGTGAASFDVVITDLGMPQVDGRAVAAAVKSLAPSTPVVLLTGWGSRLQAQNEVLQHIDRVVSKPPKLVELRAVLTDVANGKVAPTVSSQAST